GRNRAGSALKSINIDTQLNTESTIATTNGLTGSWPRQPQLTCPAMLNRSETMLSEMKSTVDPAHATSCARPLKKSKPSSSSHPTAASHRAEGQLAHMLNHGGGAVPTFNKEEAMRPKPITIRA